MGLTIVLVLVLVLVLASAYWYEADHGRALHRYMFISDSSWAQ